MSESADLLEEAAFKISHGGQILRLASLQSKDEALARELWRLSAAAEAMAEELEDSFRVYHAAVRGRRIRER